MKKIVAFVLPVDDAEARKDAAADGAPPHSSREEVPGDPVTPAAGAMKMEAVVSDSQAERLLAALLEQRSGTDIGPTMEELVLKELEVAGPDAQDLFARIVLGVERRLISQVYTDCDRVKTRASARLGINRNTLHKKLRLYHLVDDEDEDETT